jgi:hypothetical protein
MPAGRFCEAKLPRSGFFQHYFYVPQVAWQRRCDRYCSLVHHLARQEGFTRIGVSFANLQTGRRWAAYQGGFRG